jgi:hypothetical protein
VREILHKNSTWDGTIVPRLAFPLSFVSQLTLGRVSDQPGTTALRDVSWCIAPFGANCRQG